MKRTYELFSNAGYILAYANNSTIAFTVFYSVLALANQFAKGGTDGIPL